MFQYGILEVVGMGEEGEDMEPILVVVENAN